MPRSRADRAAALVFALLALATLAAFAWAQRVKRDPLVLDRVTFVGVPSPNPAAALALAAISTPAPASRPLNPTSPRAARIRLASGAPPDAA